MKQLFYSIIFICCLVIVGACENHKTIVDQQPIITFSEDVTDGCQEFISEELNLNSGLVASILFQYNEEERTIDMEVGLYEGIIVTRESVAHYNGIFHFTVNQSVEDSIDNSTTRVNYIRIAPFERLYEEFNQGIDLIDRRVDEEAISLGIMPESIHLKFKLTATKGFCVGQDIFIEINGTRV